MSSEQQDSAVNTKPSVVKQELTSSGGQSNTDVSSTQQQQQQCVPIISLGPHYPQFAAQPTILQTNPATNEGNDEMKEG